MPIGAVRPGKAGRYGGLIVAVDRSSGSRPWRKIVRSCALLLVASIVFAGCMVPSAPPASAPVTWPPARTASQVTPSQVRSVVAGAPLLFEENRGQTAASVRFMARGQSLTAFFTSGGVTYRLLDREAAPGSVADNSGGLSDPASAPPPSVASWLLQQEPVGGQAVLPVSMDSAETVVSYLRGPQES